MMCGSTKPKEVVGSGGDSGTGPKCPRCGKTVYDAERAIGVNTVNVLFRFCPSACLSVYLEVCLPVLDAARPSMMLSEPSASTR